MRRLAILLIDILVVGLATVLALLIRDDFQFSIDRIAAIAPHLAMTVLFAAVALCVSGLFNSIWRFTAATDYFKVAGVAAFAVIAATAIGFSIDRLYNIPRSLPLLQFLLISTSLITLRLLAQRRYRSRSQRATRVSEPVSTISTFGQQGILVIGLNSLTDLFLQSARDYAPDNIKIVGLLGRQERHTGRMVQGYQVLGTPEQVNDVIRDLEVHGVSVDRIVISLKFDELSARAQSALLEIEQKSSTRLEFITERLGLDSPQRTRPHMPPADTGKPSEFAVSLNDDEQSAIERRPFWQFKRALDFIGALMLILAWSPIIVIVAALVAYDVGFPTVFWQQRPGRGGRPFRLLKFRTMAAAHDRRGRRIPDDQRLTSIGQMLRRFRLDEFPQLYNILIGDMSFVGPRPLLLVDQPPGVNPRLLVRPGLTGWAQVSGGRIVSMHEKTALDMWYLRHASMAVDLRIMFRTLSIVLLGERRDEGAILTAYSELDLVPQADHLRGITGRE